MDYKNRMITEYRELKERHGKLHKMCAGYIAGTLDFKPNCPIDMLLHQLDIMNDYMFVLEQRAEIEGIEL